MSMRPSIKILMITHNRAEYTRLSLEYVCRSADENVKIVIWDNGSNRETREIVRGYEAHKSVERIIFSETNEYLRNPTNWFWKQYQGADLLGKVDDDCLVPEEWCAVLAKAHKDIPEAGMLCCWHFMPEDFDRDLAKRKIYRFGDHQILRNCWVAGSGYLMKNEVIHKLGLLRPNESFSDYCIRAAAKGFINGWYYPFLLQEHMDDPRAPHTGIRSEEDFRKMIPLSARNRGIRTRNQWIQRLSMSAREIQACSIDPNDFIGIKPRIMRKAARMMGRHYYPRVK